MGTDLRLRNAEQICSHMAYQMISLHYHATTISQPASAQLQWSAHRHTLEDSLAYNLHLSVHVLLFRAPQPLFFLHFNVTFGQAITQFGPFSQVLL